MEPPEWYRIREVSWKDYVQCLDSLYKVLEKRHVSEGSDDVFLKTILTDYTGMTELEWTLAERHRRYEKALSMKMGDFHEELAGKLPGYMTLPTGHVSGCDVKKLDDSEYWEFKNRDNTMNSGSSDSVVRKLTKIHEMGKIPFLVLVNTERKTIPRPKGALAFIRVMTGKQAYAHMSGRETFFADLQQTLSETFKRYKTYADLKKETP